MTDPPSDTGVEPDRGLSDSTPRWVKVFGTIALVLVLLSVILQIIGGGNHGPGRHLPSGDAGRDTSPASVTKDHTPLIDLGEKKP